MGILRQSKFQTYLNTNLNSSSAVPIIFLLFFFYQLQSHFHNCTITIRIDAYQNNSVSEFVSHEKHTKILSSRWQVADTAQYIRRFVIRVRILTTIPFCRYLSYLLSTLSTNQFLSPCFTLQYFLFATLRPLL